MFISVLAVDLRACRTEFRVAYRQLHRAAGFKFGQLSVLRSKRKLYLCSWETNAATAILCRSRTLLRDSSKFYSIASFSTASPSSSTQSVSTNQSQSDTAREEEEERQKKSEKVRRSTYLGLFGLCMMLGFGSAIIVMEYGKPLQDEHGNMIYDEFSHLPTVRQHIARSLREVKLFLKFVQEPSRDKLLPEPLKEPYYQPPYTLVIEMNGILVHPEWTYQTGWRFKKRPAIDFFLQQVGYPHFEVVIYTAEQGFTAFPIVDSLDPQGLIMYRLFRDATKYMKGHHVKDLSKLNRDLKKVIYIDWDPNSFQLQPENALRLTKWDGSNDDTSLIDLAALLRAIVASGTDDVRPIIQYYSKEEDPISAFRENQQRLQMELEKQRSQQPQQSLVKSFSGRLFGSQRHK